MCLDRNDLTGRPAGGKSCMIRLEKIVGAFLRPRKAGRKQKAGEK